MSTGAISGQGGTAARNRTPRSKAAARGQATARRKGLLGFLERIGLGALTVILSINLWTGFPVLALWIGSHCSGGNILSMGGIAISVIALAALLAVGVVVMTRVSLRYDKVIGRPPPPRKPAPWLESMRTARESPDPARREINAIEAIVVVSVVAAFIAFEVWFFTLAGSPLG